ncbi:response regulator [Sphingobacterium alkalisoli]|uniref:Response regulator n=1 Tax=Sphingobacterium alkalisoli TaxID=1874115 RepID=A0A4U0H7Q2_9SPHI|nr:response regulator [Sphingobacterium alkalisoli]TJY67867.1 response regulator [Sphingobacterium alkalisoli]GGH10840.1 hypothetical protein GCM10011418_09350 [Sphingobacterium alkalisoli]
MMDQKKIFVCDDDSGIADMLEMVFEILDSETVTETNSIHAYEKILHLKPDVVIVDLWMPVVTGDQLIRKIRKNEDMKETFILCISASRDGKDIALEAGANTFLPKPFDLDEILAIVEKAL